MITFTCKADASITMPKRDAFFLLELMGQRKTVPGSLLEDEVPKVLKQLKTALNAVKSESTTNKPTEENSLKAIAPLAQSLVDLLEAAEINSCNVTWFDATNLM